MNEFVNESSRTFDLLAIDCRASRRMDCELTITVVLPPARTLVAWLIDSRIPGGLGILVRDRITLGYASCFGSPAAFLALAQ